MSKIDTTTEAASAIAYQISFLESLRDHIAGDDVLLKHRALMTAWVLNNYMNKQMACDLELALKDN